MHVLQLINSLAVGGAEQTVCNLVQADDNTKYTVCALGTDDDLLSDIQNKGIPVFLCNERFRFDPRAIYRLYRIVSELKIDIIHAHLPYAQTLGRLIASKADVNATVSTQHSIQEVYHPVTGWLERTTASVDDATVAVSDGVKQSFSQNKESKSQRNWHVIHNGINVDTFAQNIKKAVNIRPEYDLGTGSVFLNVGRLVPAKAQSVLIDAMSEAIPMLDDPHLLITGDGPLREQLRQQINQLGIQSYVTLVGHATPIEPYYAAADVFVLSSCKEGLPITLLEAMSAELPIVATDIPGVSEVIIRGETGYLVPERDSRRLADAMIESANDTRNKMGQAGKQHVESEFSIERMVSQYREVYTCVMDK